MFALATEITEPGELAYAIWSLCLSQVGEGKFANYAVIKGVLGCVDDEIYRRVIAPYEDAKIGENGDAL